MLPRRGLAISIGLVLALGRPATADIDNAKAEQLFNEAVALRDRDPQQACAKFEQSYAANPQAIGTLLNIALCDEATGRIASAIAKLTEIVDRAHEQKLDEYLRAAEQHLALLRPEVPHLTITFAEPPVAETTLLVDDRVIPLHHLANLPVDPGERVIVVTAPGRIAFRKSIVLARRASEQLVVPPLEKSVTKSSRRTLGKITTIAGIATTTTGITLALVALSRYQEPFDSGACDRETRVCTADGSATVESARTLGSVSTVVTAVGIGAAAAGVYLWLRGPSATAERKVSLLPHVGRDGAGLVAVGWF